MLNKQPDSILLEIFQYLDSKELACMALVFKKAARLISENSFLFFKKIEFNKYLDEAKAKASLNEYLAALQALDKAFQLAPSNSERLLILSEAKPLLKKLKYNHFHLIVEHQIYYTNTAKNEESNEHAKIFDSWKWRENKLESSVKTRPKSSCCLVV